MKILIFGGTDWGFSTLPAPGKTDRYTRFFVKQHEVYVTFAALDRILKRELATIGAPPYACNAVTVINGCAPGADFIGATWAASRGCPVKDFPAKWEAFDRAAGPMRNDQMADAGPDVGVGLPGGSGTENMAGKLLAIGARVCRLTWDESLTRLVENWSGTASAEVPKQ